MNWAAGWQAVVFAKVDNTGDFGRDPPVSLPCSLGKGMRVPAWIWPVQLTACAPGSHLTEADLKRPKQEQAATYFSPTLWETNKEICSSTAQAALPGPNPTASLGGEFRVGPHLGLVSLNHRPQFYPGLSEDALVCSLLHT